MAGALRKILRNRVPKRVRSDLGREFYNSHVQQLFKQKDIVHFGVYNYTKASMIERFHRTLRNKLWRFFDVTNTWRYVEVLPKLVAGYNATKHGSTGMAPDQVTAINQHEAWNSIYGDMLEQRRAWRRKRKPGEMPQDTDLRVGDNVRLSKAKHVFETGYSYAWTKELFQIRAVLPPIRGLSESRYRYRVRDLKGENILGSFHREELQKVRNVEKEIRKVVSRNKKGKFVQWRGYPDALRTFIPA